MICWGFSLMDAVSSDVCLGHVRCLRSHGSHAQLETLSWVPKVRCVCVPRELAEGTPVGFGAGGKIVNLAA